MELGFHDSFKCPDYTALHYCVRRAHSIDRVSGLEVICTTFFMLNSAKHKVLTAYKN